MRTFYLGLVFFICLLGSFIVWPEIDLVVSALFAHGVDGFVLRDHWLLNGLMKVVFYGSRFVAVGLLVGCLYALGRGKRELAKKLCFVFLCLLIGPGLMANVVFKDHWGRARPREIVEFGGLKQFTPAFVMSDQCKRNCSFVSGDASFGFFLTCFAYLVAPRRRRSVFVGTVLVGIVFAGARLLLGAHFLSDVLAAIVLVMGVNAALYALFYSKKELQDFWRDLTVTP